MKIAKLSCRRRSFGCHDFLLRLKQAILRVGRSGFGVEKRCRHLCLLPPIYVLTSDAPVVHANWQTPSEDEASG